MNAFLQMSMTEFRMALRNFIYMFFAFVFPPMMLLLFGGMYGNEPTAFYGGHGAVDVLTPAYIGMILAVSGIMGLPLQISEYRQHKILKRFKATPIHTGSIMLPHFIVNCLLSMIGTAILIVVGIGVFHLHFLGNVFPFLFAYFLSMACIFSIGFLIAAVAPNIRAASAIAYIIYFPMLFLSGATMPLQMLPKVMLTISKFIPLTYCVEILQGTWMGDPLSSFLKPILVTASIAVVCTGVSIKIFRWE